MNSRERLLTEHRQAATADLAYFIQLVHPKRVLGSIHKEVIRWMTREDKKPYQLLLLPRDHQKSALAAYYSAWRITKDPAIRILYISSTSNLAVKQLKFIKDILTCDKYRMYWPEMVNVAEATREKWTETEISVDHPIRKSENLRDPTVFTAGLTTSIVGLHCDLAVLDDIVVPENAYTEEGREKVETQASYLTSIEGTDSEELVVGTHYHPKDYYFKLKETMSKRFDEYGNLVKEEPLYEVFQREVENRGDGTGEFLWPRQQNKDGRWFGFNQKILEDKRDKYHDKVAFRAQYYNDPSAFDHGMINRDLFQYYEPKRLKKIEGRWTYDGFRLNIFASVDFAFSFGKRADYTAIVVVGVDANSNYYVLDIERFKADSIPEYFKRILSLHQRWDFRKLRAETTVAQRVIVNDLRNNYIRKHGLALSIDEFSPSSKQGTKDERITAILQPRYENRQIWHYEGGNCQTLEEELITPNPAHDDIKDALASCIDVCVPPTIQKYVQKPLLMQNDYINTRFGGIG